MALKYCDKPVLNYSNQSASDNWRSRFPSDARPIAEAPPQTIFAYEANGQGCLAHFRSGAFRKLTWQRDPKTRAASLREDGTKNGGPGDVYAAEERGLAMARTSAANRKRLADLKVRARQERILQAKKSGKPEIPDRILKKLAALNLPNDPWVYQVCLDALMRGA